MDVESYEVEEESLRWWSLTDIWHMMDIIYIYTYVNRTIQNMYSQHLFSFLEFLNKRTYIHTFIFVHEYAYAYYISL